MAHRVVITGLGTVSPYGVGAKNLWASMSKGVASLRFNEKLGVVVGEIPRGSGPDQWSLDQFSSRDRREMNAPTLLALTAAEEALRDAGLQDVDQGFHDETGVNIGMGISDLEEIVHTGNLIAQNKARQVGPFFVPRILTNIPAGYVAIRHGLRGGNSSTTTACATGVSCIAEAFSQIQAGRVRRVVAGSVESCLNRIAVVGFQRMRALASGTESVNARDMTISRPFDVNRSGFVLSEGAGMVIMERLEDARQRGAGMYAEVLGFGISNDAHHLTAPRADGLASTLCMRRCLRDAGLEPAQVTYINAHATSTKVGDEAEAVSVASVFGPRVHVSSFKGHLGHCVSAAGSIESILTALSIKHGQVLPTLNLTQTDVKADVNLVMNQPKDWSSTDRRIALKNSFGFGGAFVSIALAQI